MRNFLIIIIFFFTLNSCKKDNTIDSNDDSKIDSTKKTIIQKTNFTGYVQKGPFINGSSVVIYELDSFLNQTGKSYNSTIADNSGKYENKKIELSTGFAELKADGFYFNEISGLISPAQLTLYAIVDISKDTSANINLLTHLERGRIRYLITNKGYSFKDAKNQAKSEVLKIFSIDKSDISNFEKLNLNNTGDDNAVLLAISAIIQGFRTTSEMSELLANIITDINTDGVLSDSTIGSKLLDDAKLLDLSVVKQNLEKRYKDLSLTVSIPNFESYVKVFIDNTKYKTNKTIKYPNISKYGINILSDSVNVIEGNSKLNWDFGYSMSAEIPIGCTLKVVLRGGMWWYRSMPNGPINWTISQYNNETQTFTSTEHGKVCDLTIQLPIEKDTVIVDYYENNSIIPTKTKSIIIE